MIRIYRVGIVLFALAADGVRAQPARLSVEDALDKSVQELRIESTPLPQALAKLEEHTQIRFQIDRETLARMPYGERTQIAINVRHLALRKALPQVFAGLGLSMTVTRELVRLEPLPAVARMPAPLTLDDLRLLERLAGATWTQLDPSTIALQFQIDPASEPRAAFDRAMQQIAADNAIDQLEQAVRALGWVWMPKNGGLQLQRRGDFLRAQLERPIEVNFQRATVETVLQETGRKAGLPVSFEPGALQRVPQDQWTLVQRPATARDVFERVAAKTGLRYEIVDDSVRFSLAAAAPDGPRPANPPGAGQRVVAQVSLNILPGISINMPIFENELPAPYLDKLRQRALKKIQEELDKE
ncbi:MAG: hypothetical protein AB7Q17_02265 [Phycisphaerae bacterium]